MIGCETVRSHLHLHDFLKLPEINHCHLQVFDHVMLKRDQTFMFVSEMKNQQQPPCLPATLNTMLAYSYYSVNEVTWLQCALNTMLTYSYSSVNEVTWLQCALNTMLACSYSSVNEVTWIQCALKTWCYFQLLNHFKAHN